MPARILIALSMAIPAFGGEALFDRGAPRIYEGERLSGLAMPIGGIGTGTVWLSGSGTLSVWQIFNNLSEVRVPHTFLAVRARAGGDPIVRVLATEPEAGFAPVASLRYRGDYPIAWIDYQDPALPVAVALEAYNPMIPLETKDSAIPCAIFKLTATNKGTKPAEVAFALAAQNAVGYDGNGAIDGRSFWAYGANRNTFRGGEESALLDMGIAGDEPPAMAKPVDLLAIGRRDRALVACGNLTVTFGLPRRGAAPATDAVWLEGAGAATDSRALDAVARIASAGGAVLISNPAPALLEAIAARHAEEKAAPKKSAPVVFEDFEKPTYEGWTIEGEAFGKGPHTGTTSGQQNVSGFQGRRLVNTYRPDDEPQGRALSKPFTIQRKFIGFLVGGGSHEGRTCINLLVDGKSVRSTTGKDNEVLEPAAWDVSALAGKEARIEILDRASGPWGHINVDQIIFTDEPPQVVLAAIESIEAVAKALPLRYKGAKSVDAPQSISPLAWAIRRVIALEGAAPEEAGFRVLMRDQAGGPIVLAGPFGKGKIVLVLADNVPTFYALGLLGSMLGAQYRHGDGVAPDSPLYGEMALAVLAGGATGCARWEDGEALARDLADDGRLSGPNDSGASPAGQTYDGAVSLAFTLEPGATRTVPFVLAWFFPNLERFGHKGNKYADWFSSARAVAHYVESRYAELDRLTHLYHDTVYASNLPYWFIDAFTSQSCIFRGI
ncbi:MAG: hypothetical protein JXP34_17080, partial [Planctomycetes bacterium]|nr:hypothetical protein [Planctomycetota bacterium]